MPDPDSYGAPKADYAVNAMGQRVGKTAGTVATRFHYGLSGRLLAEFADDVVAPLAVDTEREYIWLDGLLIGDMVSTYLGTIPTGSTLRAVHTDHLGSPRRRTNPDKSLAWDAVYRPFGELDNNPGAGFNHRFPGQYADAETGLYYNYFRDYDAATGRYIQSDPIGLGGGWNTYGYVGGNPVTRVDPRGQNTIAIGAGVGSIGGPPGAVIGGIIGGVVAVAGYLIYDYCTDDDDRGNCYREKIEIEEATSGYPAIQAVIVKCEYYCPDTGEEFIVRLDITDEMGENGPMNLEEICPYVMGGAAFGGG